MLQKSSKIVLDTSRLLRIISHIERTVPLVRVHYRGARLFNNREALFSPANRTAWFTGSA